MFPQTVRIKLATVAAIAPLSARSSAMMCACCLQTSSNHHPSCVARVPHGDGLYLQASSHQNRCYALSSDQACQTAHKRDALSITNAPRIFAALPIPSPSCGTRVRWPCGLIPPRSRVGYWHTHTAPTPHTCHSSPQTPVRACRHATRITRARRVATVARRSAQTRVSTPVTECECWKACSRASPSVVHGGIKLLGNVGSCLLHQALELAQGAAVASALAK